MGSKEGLPGLYTLLSPFYRLCASTLFWFKYHPSGGVHYWRVPMCVKPDLMGSSTNTRNKKDIDYELNCKQTVVMCGPIALIPCPVQVTLASCQLIEHWLYFLWRRGLSNRYRSRAECSASIFATGKKTSGLEYVDVYDICLCMCIWMCVECEYECVQAFIYIADYWKPSIPNHPFCIARISLQNI